MGVLGKSHLRSERDHAQRAVGAADNFEGRGDDESAGGWKMVEINQAGQAEAARAMHVGMAGKSGIKAASLASIGANGLDANP